MKKIVLLPKTDTVILCLPEQWIGIPIICKLTPMSGHFINNDEPEIEKTIIFHNKKRRKKKE
ncbi:MAG: hypothetical protein FWC34_07175 [Bacteroidetes bacterium]|nr:hypothetical protein [Bacteroidota bacterium]MCL2303365.1 hypothetical protein [Lentimicrobiaceae bacterium]